MKNSAIKLQGQITWSVGKPGEEPRIYNNDPTKNLIVNQGLGRFLQDPVPFVFTDCQVGTGDGETTPDMTALVNPQGSPVSRVGFPSYANNGEFASISYTYVFPANVFTGLSITEVGFFNGIVGTLSSRVRLKDSNGTPISITMSEGEVLSIDYSVRLYIPTGDTTGTFTVDGDTYNYRMRVASRDAWVLSNQGRPLTGGVAYSTDVLGTEDSEPSGLSDSFSATIAPYVSGSYQRTYSINFGLDQGNFPGGIGSMMFGDSSQAYQVSFSPKLPKDSTKLLSFSGFFIFSIG